jgi:tetratricopeptide (TPR) repeat protein
VNEDIQARAAAAVMALAHRSESAGKKDAVCAKGKQWQAMPFDPRSKMQVEKLREAVAFYEIAESLHREAAGLGYPRAMLLESMGAFDEAIAAFESLGGTYYEAPGKMGAQRCREKQAGSYDEMASLGLPQEFLDAMQGLDADAFFAAQGPSDADIDAKLARVAAKNAKAKPGKADQDDGNRQQAAETAQRFVGHLLDRDYAAARAMLHPHESGLTEAELRDAFEPMFEGEPFPESANVFDVKTDMPGLDIDDIAWVYVTIDSENVEAVSLIVAREKKRYYVRNIEWGRP